MIFFFINLGLCLMLVILQPKVKFVKKLKNQLGYQSRNWVLEIEKFDKKSINGVLKKKSCIFFKKFKK